MYLVKICSRICCAFTEATSHQATVSEELTSILEALFAEDIPAEQEERTPEEGRTNLVTTMEYAMIFGSIGDTPETPMEHFCTRSQCLLPWIIGQSLCIKNNAKVCLE